MSDDAAKYGATTRDSINNLDCPDCGEWFPTFDRLARHRHARHGPPTPQTGDSMAKKKTSKRPRAIDNATAPEPDAPRRGRAKRAAQRGGIPAPSQSERESEYHPFLKSSDIGDLDDNAVLLLTGKVRVADSGFGEQVICECKYAGQIYDWGFKVNGVNHRLLFKRFGKDERKWKGKVNVTVKEFNGNPYVAVDRS